MTDSFANDIKGAWDSCTKLVDKDDSVRGAAQAGFAVVCFFPCACVWNVCVSPARCCSGDIMPIAVGALGTIVSIIPIVIVFAAMFVPGLVAAGLGALGRLVKLW